MTMEDELVSVANIVAKIYAELKDKDPQHELLKFVEITREEIIFVPQYREEFEDRFPPINPNSGYRHSLYRLTNYYNAICKALNRNPGFAELTDKLREKYGLIKK